MAGRRCPVFVLLTCILVGISNVHCFARHPKVYTVNLDLPPEQRWAHVVRDHKEFVKNVHAVFRSMLPRLAVPLVERIIGRLEKYLPQPYAAEIKGIARALNTSIGDAVLPNIVYDLSAFCTSIVAQDSKGQIWHSRNLDYNFKAMMKSLIIVVNFQRGGKTVYTASTIAGLVGIITGQKPNGFTVSLDQRSKGGLLPWKNALIALTNRRSKAISFLLRDTMEKAANFNEAVSMLSHHVIIAPAYFIVGGVKPGEGAVITRDRLRAKNVWRLEPSRGRWYLVETNYDHWEASLKHDPRRRMAEQLMNSTGQGHVNEKTLFKIMSAHPVYNSDTVYTTIMSAGEPGIHTVWVNDAK